MLLTIAGRELRSLFLSPLAWGLRGLLEIFVRQGTVAAVWPETLALLAFFAFCMVVSWRAFRRGGRSDG